MQDFYGYLRTNLKNHYGANRLYSGMGATVDEDGNAGAREVMVNNSDTEFKLTADNSWFVPLGSYTTGDCDHAFNPPPDRS